MGHHDGLMDATRIRELLTELGRRLDGRGVEGRIFLVGGAAMALAYSRDRLTRDIDAVFEPKAVIYEEAAHMADAHGLPADWLNDGVKGMLPDRTEATDGPMSFSSNGIHVGVASAEYMFAMKASAARSEADHGDLSTLTAKLGIGTTAEAFEIIEKHYSRGRLGPKTQFIIESVVAHAIGRRDEA